MRCCSEESIFKVTYNGDIMKNDIILICKNCITKRPFNTQILSIEEVGN